jgi:hypothetical protein
LGRVSSPFFAYSTQYVAESQFSIFTQRCVRFALEPLPRRLLRRVAAAAVVAAATAAAVIENQ